MRKIYLFVKFSFSLLVQECGQCTNGHFMCNIRPPLGVNVLALGSRVWLDVHYISSASSHLIIGTCYFLINLIYTVECKDFSKFSTISMLTLKPSAHFRVPGRSYENWGCFHT